MTNLNESHGPTLQSIGNSAQIKSLTIPIVESPNIDHLRKYLSDQGSLLPRRLTGLSAKDHRNLVKKLKSERILGSLPFISKKN